MSARHHILRRLRAARPPFPDAPPRPAVYLPVTAVEDASPEALLQRFTAEAERLLAQVHTVSGDDAACAAILDLLRTHSAQQVMAWDFAHIPLAGLAAALANAGIAVIHPDITGEFGAETLASLRDVPVGLTGVDAAAAATGTLIVSTAPGKGRLPTILPPAHIAVVRLAQIKPNLETWLADQRAAGGARLRQTGNVCFISGPSRTGDIEMTLVMGVHGPGTLHVVVVR
jgi:L-lactate dehydrogenase complex protein LldG